MLIIALYHDSIQRKTKVNLNKDEEKATIVIRMPKETANKLKWLSYNMNTSVAELCRQGIDKIIKENYKKFPNPP